MTHPQPIPPSPGLLAAIGGNEDRQGTMAVLKALVRACADPGAAPLEIVVLTAASGEPDLLWSHYQPAFESLGARPHWLDLRSRDTAGLPASLDLLRRAGLVFLTGGDQARLMDVMGGTPLHALIRRRHLTEGMAVAGTSAGASAIGQLMPVGDMGDQIAGELHQPLSAGLGLLPRLVIDQHFAQRKRHARLLHLLTCDPRHIGVGIDEDTALILQPGRSLRVIGSGAVTVIDCTHARQRTDAIDGHGPTAIVALDQVGMVLLPAGTHFSLQGDGEAPEPPVHLRSLVDALMTTAGPD